MNSYLRFLIRALSVKKSTCLVLFSVSGMQVIGVYCEIGPGTFKCVLQMEIIDSLYLFCCPITK